MRNRKVTGIFERRGDAEKLKEELLHAGVALHRIIVSDKVVAVVARSRPVVDELDAELADFDDRSETVLLVAHGGLIAGLVTGLMDLPTSVWPSFGGLGNCRWAVLARRDDHPRWRLAGYNIGA